MEEIREIPVEIDVATMRLIGRHCPTHMLYCGGPDQWAPGNHLDDLKVLQARGILPKNVKAKYYQDLRHEFVVIPTMIPAVRDFCVDSILSVKEARSCL